MKIPIEVEVVMEKCKECPRMEIDSISVTTGSIHRCKNVQLCRTIIDLWEKRGEAE